MTRDLSADFQALVFVLRSNGGEMLFWGQMGILAAIPRVPTALPYWRSGIQFIWVMYDDYLFAKPLAQPRLTTQRLPLQVGGGGGGDAAGLDTVAGREAGAAAQLQQGSGSFTAAAAAGQSHDT